MRRVDLEHIIRASGSIANSRDIVIIGSQAVLGSFPNAPEELLVSNEADVYPLEAPERSDLIDGSIGEGSPFHSTFKYYAHGVAPETAVLPSSWRSRAVIVENENTRGIRGHCLSMPDLCLSKLAAGREKDLTFVRVALNHGIVDPAAMAPLIPEMPAGKQEFVRQRLKGLIASVS